MTAPLPPDLRWIGFDLDDTLHYFKRATQRAATATFGEIERQLGIGSKELNETYRGILRTAQNGHFARPMTAREYRAERFGALLEGFKCDPGPQLTQLLDVYDAALADALELRPGARETLSAAKRAGLSVMVISEGPHDAQETTIERLGIAPFIDLLVTSAGEGASKDKGLFERALARAGCEPHEILYVGDSFARDIIPAAKLGIASVYVGEESPPNDMTTASMTLATLAQLLTGQTPTSR